MTLGQRWLNALGPEALAPGMLVTVPWSVGGDYPKARGARIVAAASFPGVTGYMSGVGCVGTARDCLPDMDDDATRGAALGVLRRLFGRHVWIDYDHRKHRSEPPTFEVFADDGDFACSFLGGGASEEEALVKAAEAWKGKNP